MQVVAPQAFSHVTALARPVDAGEVVDVDDELGAQLVEQGWKTPAKAGKAKLETVTPSASEEG